MAEFKIDRLKFRWKGDWTNQTTYRKDDIVSYGGKVYVCLQEHTSANNFYFDLTPSAVTVTYPVTVNTDNLNSEPHGVFYLNSQESPELRVLKGRRYIFNQNDISNKNFNSEVHPLLISNVENGTLAGGYIYTDGIEYFIDNVKVTQAQYLEQFSASNFRRVEITIPFNAPKKLFYFSPYNTNMGGRINTEYAANWELMFDGYSWKGDWQKDTRYNLDDLVKYNGNIYQCISEHTSTDEIQDSFLDDIANWTIYSRGYNWRNTWQTETVYNVNDVVTYRGIAYICNLGHTSAADTEEGLELDQSKWTIVSRSDYWLTDWETEFRYVNDDIVRYGGRVYRCVDGHTSAASDTDGLEADNALWEIVVDGIEFKGDWQPGVRYKTGDVVRYGPSLWKAINGHSSTDNLKTDESNWTVYVLGLGYEELWNEFNEYKKGDIVLYGGYTYLALENNSGITPSANGKLQDTGAWELLTTGYKIQGEWNDAVSYKTGDVITNSGALYIAIADNSNTYPDSNANIWQIVVPGSQWKAEWIDNVEYFLGDVVTYAGTAYICVDRHISSATDARPDLDILNVAQNYWVVLIQGTPTNILTTRGDIKTFDGTDTARLAIGFGGQALKSNGATFTWGSYDVVPNVFYVATSGRDEPTFGKQLSSPFRTVKYATQYILEDVANRTPATIFIKTGLYEEELPIVVPADTALVGDELRSTTIMPAAGFESSNMFYVRNGSGIRNMTLQGLTGTLGEPNEFLTRRPSAGAFVSLDPGFGPSDQSAWITTKSPYVQNVSTFGTGCIGMKVDGSLHGGGNRSIVANDFTQVLSDGIGYWALNQGRSELVSVFTYYCHIGYLATDGGIVRATNGNNSYGTYGSVAEGFDASETPINGSVENRDNEALIQEIFTYGTTEQQILAVGYEHAGQDYTSANIAFSGSGFGAVGAYTEFRNSAVSNIRLLDPGDSSVPGGFGYQFVANNAQSGNAGSITLSGADIGTEELYLGMRIVIVSGRGVGQYGEITAFNPSTKVVIVSRESDGAQGWDHFQPGWPIEEVLDETTRYAIEPRVDVAEPEFSSSVLFSTNTNDLWNRVSYANGTYVAISIGTSIQVATSSNGTSWNKVGSPLGGSSGNGRSDIVYTGQNFVVQLYATPLSNTTPIDRVSVSSDGASWSEVTLPISNNWAAIASDQNGSVIIIGEDGQTVVSDDHGASWTQATTISTTTEEWRTAAYGNGVYVVLDNVNGTIAYSSDVGTTWTKVTPFTGAIDWVDIVYGNGRFVAISDTGNTVARSFDGVNWYTSTIESASEFQRVSYGGGLFIATGAVGVVALSQDGAVWRTTKDDSSVYATVSSEDWRDAAYNPSSGSWVLVTYGNQWNSLSAGARALVRARVENTRVTSLIVYDPGSGYVSTPQVTVYDNANTIDAAFEVFLHSGVLAQPEMSNRGQGYVTATATVTGDGFAEIFQTRRILKLVNVSAIPGPGANLEINGIDDKRYSITTISDVEGTGPYSMTLTISPFLGVEESPSQSTAVTIRERYSQIRLTGHDFLDIGTGNFNSTRYPTLYLEGESPENARQPFNETVASGGGRVFYTSTDQDGNFRVGELFQVEQARGVVTISASQFDLSGLSELRLGGIQVGGSAVVIREFSKDATFIADSNNIVPTQKAIKAYVESRISGGGSNAQTNTLVAGQVEITGDRISTRSGFPINFNAPVNMTSGYTGSLLAQQYMLRGANTQIE